MRSTERACVPRGAGTARRDRTSAHGRSAQKMTSRAVCEAPREMGRGVSARSRLLHPPPPPAPPVHRHHHHHHHHHHQQRSAQVSIVIALISARGRGVSADAAMRRRSLLSSFRSWSGLALLPIPTPPHWTPPNRTRMAGSGQVGLFMGRPQQHGPRCVLGL